MPLIKKQLLLLAGLLSVLLLSVLLYQFGWSPKSEPESHFSSWLTRDEPDDVLVRQALVPVFGDLEQIGERKVLRVLVTHSRSNYYLDRGQARGVAHDLAKAFGEDLAHRFKLKPNRLQVVFVPTTHDRMLRWLAEGRGDIAIGVLMDKRADVVFSDPFIANGQWVYVGRSDQPPVNRLEDLQSREVAVRRSSAAYRELLAFNDWLDALDLTPMKIVAVDEHLDDEDVFELIDAGVYAGTVSLDHAARLWSRTYPGLQVAANQPLKTDVAIGWALRRDAPQLLAEVNRFMADHRAGTSFGNQLLTRYFGESRTLKPLSAINSQQARYGNMVELFKRYGEQYGFNWMLLMAQAYQESGLNQSARSAKGAVGVMQVLPSTASAKPVSVRNVQKLENNIHAGAKYLAHLRDDYFNSRYIAEVDKQLFAIAAYNAGPSRIQRLREMAREQGFDPNRWHHHVEVIAARKIGSETTQYVNNIYKYYISYRRLEEAVAVREQIKAQAVQELMARVEAESAAQPTQLSQRSELPSASLIQR